MRKSPVFDIENRPSPNSVGDGVGQPVSTRQGRPGITERVYVPTPGSQIGPITAAAAGADQGIAGRWGS
jgi:hypothetical protein